ncbi:hypothetical protein CLAIMM_13753, partial [Cladophialophora immunda]
RTFQLERLPKYLVLPPHSRATLCVCARPTSPRASSHGCARAQDRVNGTKRHRRLHPAVHAPAPDVLGPLGVVDGAEVAARVAGLLVAHAPLPERGVPDLAAPEPPPGPQGAVLQRAVQGHLRQEHGPRTGAGEGRVPARQLGREERPGQGQEGCQRQRGRQGHVESHARRHQADLSSSFGETWCLTFELRASSFERLGGRTRGLWEGSAIWAHLVSSRRCKGGGRLEEMGNGEKVKRTGRKALPCASDNGYRTKCYTTTPTRDGHHILAKQLDESRGLHLSKSEEKHRTSQHRLVFGKDYKNRGPLTLGRSPL